MAVLILLKSILIKTRQLIPEIGTASLFLQGSLIEGILLSTVDLLIKKRENIGSVWKALNLN